MRALCLIAAAVLPVAAFAAGGDDSRPPKPTKTTTECADGLVYDETVKSCVAPQESSLGDDALYLAVREAAWGGRYETALAALAAMSDQRDDRVLTYLGFVHRKMGNRERGMALYAEAIAANPDNLLARSYMGQAHAEAGEIALAQVQLSEIRQRGGRMTWPEFSLRQAIETGRGAAY